MILLAVLACASEPAPAPSTPTPAPAAAPSAPATAPERAGSARNIDSATLAAELAADKVPVLVDVRTPAEFADGHVAGARNIPIDQLGARLSELESYKSGPVYVICEVGGRSKSGVGLLAAKGFDAVNVTDGTAGWRAAGRPLEK